MSRIALVSFVLLLSACRSHPCGEHEDSAPASMADAPLIQEGGKICHADPTTATVMYWGDHMAELGVQYITAFDAAGWEQNDCGPYASKDQLCFTKGNQGISLHMSQVETPRLGSKMPAPSISVMAFHHSE